MKSQFNEKNDRIIGSLGFLGSQVLSDFSKKRPKVPGFEIWPKKAFWRTDCFAKTTRNGDIQHDNDDSQTRLW